MTYAAHEMGPTVPCPTRVGRAGWLPHAGTGNGFDSEMWAPILEISAPAVCRLLSALARARVPAFAAPLRGGRSDTWRLWVGTGHYLAAETVLLQQMPTLLAELPDALR